VETLVVAGGGGGGTNYNLRGAGGGAGGLVYIGNLRIPAGSTANVIVGSGGLVSARGGDSAILPYTPTYSHWFNGYSTYDYLTVTSTAYPFSLGGDFTVEAWIYLNAYGSTYTSIVDTRTGALAQTWAFGVYGTSLDFYWGTGTTLRATSSMRVPSGQWTHVAATRQSGNVYLYVNGYRDATSVTGVTTWMQQTSTTVWIGNLRDGAATGQNTYSANVYISNLRTVSGIAVYTGNFTPQTTNLSTTQSSGANIAAISSSPTLANTGAFNGTTSYLLHTFATSGPMDLATGQPSWTVECWFYCTNYAAKQTTIFDASGRVGNANSALGFWLSATGVGGWIIGNGGTGFIAYVPTMATTFALGTWYHVAMVRNTSTGRAQVYVNGVLDANSNIVTSGNMANAYTNDFSIGSDIATQLAGTGLFYGYISNLRAVKGVAVYTGNFIVPSIPLTVTQSSSGNIAAISGSQTSLLILQGTPIADASLNSTSITNSAVTMTQLVVGTGTTFLSLQNSTLVDNSIANSPIVKYYGSVSPSIFTQSTPVTDGYASVYFNGATMLQYTNSTALTTVPAIDTSVNQFTVTSTASIPNVIATAPAITPLSAYNSISFSGSSQYLTVAANTAFDYGTGDFTMECWVYTTSLAATQQIIDLFSNVSGSYIIGQCQLSLLNTGAVAFAYATTVSAASTLNTPAAAVTINSWYHIAVVRSGSAVGNLKNYVNGVLAATSAGAVTQALGTTGAISIGRQTNNSTNFFFGYISNARIVKGTAVYTGNFTVPTAPLTITQSSSGANISAITGSQTSLLLQPVAGWTAECWVYPSGDYGTYRTIFAKRVSASATTEYEGYLRTGTGVISFYNGTNYESTTTLTANTWSHCAWVYTGTNIVIYVNGVQVYTSAVTITTNTEPLVIGGARGQAEYFLGYLSNFRFTRGQVYTSTFTPPTRPLAATQTVSGNIAAITGNASSRTNLLVLQSSTYKDNSANNYLYGYTYTINTGTPLIKTDVVPFVDPVRGVIAYGGGGGGFNDNTPNANSGGSGGASWNPGYTALSSSQPSTSYYNGAAYTNTGFGNTGGVGGAAQPYGGGGGGAGSAGDSVSVGTTNGGIGQQYTISGIPTYYAGGGSGAGYPLNAGYLLSSGGLGGGGQGDNSVWAAAQVTGYVGSTGTVNATANGTPYTGGGGGSGGYGGSGIVVMRYLGTQIATGGTVTSIGGYTIHTFTTAGTFTIAANISVGSTGGNGGPYAGGGGGAAGYLGFGGNGAVGTALAAGSYGIGGGAGGGGSSSTFGGGGGGVDLWGLGGYSGAGGAAGQPGTGGSAEVILGITGNGAQPGFGSNGGLYGGGGGGGVTSSLDTSQGWGANGAFALIYSTTSSTYTYPYISPLNLVYLGNLQSTNTTQFTSNVSGVITDSNFDQNVIGNLAYSQTSVNMSVAYDSPNTNNTVSVYRTASLAANNIVASDITVTVNYQAEWMLRNSDPAFPATYDKPFNYQTAQPITTTNDPRKLTLKASFITKTGTQQDPVEPDSFL
jgi:hypothetical protein